MAATIDIQVNNTTYAEIIGDVDAVKRVFVTAKDLNGNTLNRVTIKADATVGEIEIYLPDIPTLQDSLLAEIVIISNGVTIFPAKVGQFVGSATSVDINGLCVLRTVSETQWAYYKN